MMAVILMMAAAMSGSPAPAAEPYLACGCGCCGGVTPREKPQCFASQAELDAAIVEDKAWRTNPQCATMGCSLGVYYAVCEPETSE